MKVSITFLKYKETAKKAVEEIETTDADYIHVDVMDGKFVPPVVLSIPEINELLTNTQKPLDVHLMVESPKEYIDVFSKCNTKYITIHAEIEENITYLIDYIHSKGIKAGLAINPETSIVSIVNYLEKIDYCLIMGVTPGFGGQKMMPETVAKIKELKTIREENNYRYVISFDGGINLETRHLLDELDIIAVGSFITMGDNFQERVNEIR